MEYLEILEFAEKIYAVHLHFYFFGIIKQPSDISMQCIVLQIAMTLMYGKMSYYFNYQATSM